MKSNKLNIAFITLASLALCIFIYVSTDFGQVKDIIYHANLQWLFIAVICMFSYWLLESGILYCTANSIKRKLSFHKAIKTTMIGQFFNNLTPFSSGGQPMQIYYMSKQNFDIGEASSILLMKFIIYQGALIIYTGLLLILRLTFFVNNVSQIGYLAILGFSVNLIVILALIAIGFFPTITLKISTWTIHLLHKMHLVKQKEKTIAKVTTQIQEFHEAFHVLLTKKRVLVRAIGLTALQLTAYFLIPFCICMALHITSTSVISVIAASAFVLMVSSFVPLPGASGGAEGSFYIFFGIFIVNPALIAVAIVIWRVITFYLPLIVGIFFCRFNSAQTKQVQ